MFLYIVTCDMIRFYVQELNLCLDNVLFFLQHAFELSFVFFAQPVR